MHSLEIYTTTNLYHVYRYQHFVQTQFLFMIHGNLIQRQENFKHFLLAEFHQA